MFTLSQCNGFSATRPFPVPALLYPDEDSPSLLPLGIPLVTDEASFDDEVKPPALGEGGGGGMGFILAGIGGEGGGGGMGFIFAGIGGEGDGGGGGMGFILAGIGGEGGGVALGFCGIANIGGGGGRDVDD